MAATPVASLNEVTSQISIKKRSRFWHPVLQMNQRDDVQYALHPPPKVLGMEGSSFGFGSCSLGKMAFGATSGVLTKAANLAFAPRADSWELRRLLCATHG